MINFEQKDLNRELNLPKILPCKNKKTNNKEYWETIRRPEIIRLFEENIYGTMPEKGYFLKSEVLEQNNPIEDKFIRKQILLTINKKIKLNILLYLPISKIKVPVFLALNFKGNHTVTFDKNVFLPNDAEEKDRGIKSYRYPIEYMLKEGFGFATVFSEDIESDNKESYNYGIRNLFDEKYTWGTICAWSFGLRRIMDYLEKNAKIDSSKVILIGHSRMGKSALWAGVKDTRFWGVISNNTGCAGAALARSKLGERVSRINKVFPHWFSEKYKEYSNREEKLPIDQHMLIASMAPRPVFVSSKNLDKWADPKGEYLSCIYSNPAYELYFLKILKNNIPKINKPLIKSIVGYQLMEGEHDLNKNDWIGFISFCKYHLKN